MCNRIQQCNVAATCQAAHRHPPQPPVPTTGIHPFRHLAVQRLGAIGLPYISILTDPTTGGVSASFGFQGDIIIAESGAAIGFAGRRVIDQTIRQKLPEGFQSAEFLLEHGQVDMVVRRTELKACLANVLRLLFAKSVPE